jgi:uncharacterized membrane protein YeaQ/YmgE (transglycosylase-associated protein family)
LETRVTFILGLIVVGAIAGLIARALVPGRDPMGCAGTIALGIAGAFVGGFLGDILFGRGDTADGLEPAGLLGSIVGAVIVLLIYRAVTGGGGRRSGRRR